MLRHVTIGPLSLLLVVAAAAMPANAEPVDPPQASRTGRFTQLDVASLGKVVNRPQALDREKTVSALVELTGDPVAVQDSETPASAFDRTEALERVQDRQEAALPRLESAGADPYGQLSTVLNAVQVRVKVKDLDSVAAVPGVKTVQVSQVVRLENAAAAKFTGVHRTWQDLKLTGKGQVIGIIDTGVDYTHADFGGAGTTAAYQANNDRIIEPGTFPTAKVTGGHDFVGNAYDPDSDIKANRTPHPDRDPLDCNGHGSHVAGTAAGSGVTSAGRTYSGPYNRSTLSQQFDVEPGVAPHATVKAYKVFGCEGGVTDDIIVAAIDRAVSDGVDVINMSLGSAFGTANDLGDVAIATATDAGVLVVTSAGNNGPGPYLVGGPSTSNAALSVAAVDAQFRYLPGVRVTGAVTDTALNANLASLASPITGELVNVGLGCAATDYAAARGKIALTTRGTCARTERAVLGQRAGALAVIMINNAPELPPFEGPIPGVTIPFVGARGADAPAYRRANGQRITLSRGPGIANPTYRMAADFSSNGPRRLDSAQKPDLAAPGVSIPSVAVGTGTRAAYFSGTSMAAPHAAGVAALVRQAHPSWSPRQTKSVLMSTASPGKVRGYDSGRVGTGLIQPRRATVAKTYAWTRSGLNSLKFGSNQLGDRYAETKAFKISNRSSRTVTYDLSTRLNSSRYGASISISPRAVRIRARSTRTVRVKLYFSRDDLRRLPGATASDGGDLISLRGVILATPRTRRSTVLPLRISFVFVPVPLSNITAEPSVSQVSPGRFESIRVRNRGLHTGTAEVYSWLLRDRAGDAASSEVADLTNLGVQSLPGRVVGRPDSDRLLVFAASQATGTSTQATREVDVLLDVTGDGKHDFITFAADAGLILSGSPSGTVGSFTVDLKGKLVDAWSAIAPTNGSTVELPVLASRLKVTAATGPIGVQAEGFTVLAFVRRDKMPGTARFDPFSPALSQGNAVEVAPGRSASIPVRVDTTQVPRQSHAGWLVVTLDDRAGYPEADRVRLVLPTPAVPAASLQR